MKKNYYSVFDRKMASYGPVFDASEDVAAKRMFIASVRQEGSILNGFREDFELHRVFVFDDKTGNIDLVGMDERMIMCGDEVKI